MSITTIFTTAGSLIKEIRNIDCLMDSIEDNQESWEDGEFDTDLKPAYADKFKELECKQNALLLELESLGLSNQDIQQITGNKLFH